MTSGTGGPGDDREQVLRWLAFDHPGSPEPVGLVRVLADGGVEYLDRDGSWRVDDALTGPLLAGRTREVGEPEARRVAARLRAGHVGRAVGSEERQ